MRSINVPGTIPHLLSALSVAVLMAGCGEPAETSMAEAPPSRVDMKDFFKNPEKASFRISPDGRYISYRAPWKSRMNIFVQERGGGEPVQVTRDTIRDVGGYFWKGDRIIYSRDINGDENYIVFSAAIDGSDVKALTPEQGVRAGTMDVLHNIPGREQHIIVQMNQRNPQVFDPYLVNVNTGEVQALYANTENFENWVTDHTGTIRIATKTDGTDQVLYHRASDKEPFKEFMRTGFKDSFAPIFFTFDNKNVYAASNLNGRDKSAIVEYDMATGKEIREIYAHPEFDVYGLDYSRKRKVLTMVSWTGTKDERHFLDAETEARYGKMADKFKDYEYWIYGENDEETMFMVWAGSDRHPGTYYFYDSASGEVDEVAQLRPWIDEDQMAEMKPIKYTSRDGLTIHG